MKNKKELDLKDILEYYYWLNHEENTLINLNGLTQIVYTVDKITYKRIYIQYLELKGIKEYDESEIKYSIPLEIDINGLTFVVNIK